MNSAFLADLARQTAGLHEDGLYKAERRIVSQQDAVITLDDGQDVIAIRTMGMLSMSYDHRVVDGADADRFMADVKRDLEEFTDGGV